MFKDSNKDTGATSIDKLKNFYGPFLWMGLNCLKAKEALRGGSLPDRVRLKKVFGPT